MQPCSRLKRTIDTIARARVLSMKSSVRAASEQSARAFVYRTHVGNPATIDHVHARFCWKCRLQLPSSSKNLILQHLTDVDLVHLHDVAEAHRPLDRGGLRRKIEDRVARDELLRL